MVLDADRMKVLGDNAVDLSTPPEGQDWVVPSDATPVAEATTKTPEEVAMEAQANMVADETLWANWKADVAPSAEEPSKEVVPEVTPKTPEEEADEIIKELLWDVEDATAEVTKAAADVADAGEEDYKKKADELEIKVTDMTTKMWTLTQAYRELLDQKNGLETVNEEYTRKMQIISNNSMLQDLLRWLYLKDKDANAMTNVWDTLKAMLKEYEGIDVDDLVAKTRQVSSQPSGDGIMSWASKSVNDLFWEGTVVDL